MSRETLSTTPQTKPGARPQRSPPRNSEGEITCTHDECKDDQLIFKRLCEYNKHMDKHERPYKCNNPACRKNPGFTYAGGLLRHQREVHSMHRTKDPFFCPHTSCNRSTGSGFSRRENLEEHLRRRHSGISIDDTTESTTGTESSVVRQQQCQPQLFRSEHQSLESLTQSRKRRAADTMDPDDHDRGLDIDTTATEDRLRARITLLQQDNERIRAELAYRDQLLTDMSQENKRLRGMLATLPPLPHHTGYQPPPSG